MKKRVVVDGTTYVTSSRLEDRLNSKSLDRTSRGRAARHGDRLCRLRIERSGKTNRDREDGSELEHGLHVATLERGRCLRSTTEV
jgi:hypothetical protein